MTVDNEQQHPADEEVLTERTADTVTPGQLLSQARERKGLSQQQVADSLRLRVAVIQIIEADDYDKLASPTFVRGYLRSMAKALEVNEEQIFAAYRATHQEKTTDTSASMRSFSRRKVRERNDSRLRWISYIIIIVVIASALLWWWQDSGFSMDSITGSEDAPTEQEAQQARESSPDIPQVVRPSTNGMNGQQVPEDEIDTSQTSAVIVEGGETPSEPPPLPIDEPTEEPTDESAEASTEEPIEASTDEPAQEPTEIAQDSAPVVTDESAADLVFTFNDACWVKVTDATGEDIAIGVKAAGYRMELTGEAPFDIILCRPESVAITYQGEPVNLDNFVRERSVTFTLN
ncbi:RodZ domain-containing protein [Pseudidiomarina salilacus]|uniref:RodZ domain-containing protein n=1 Tax=Pseudidiomarina salilacus TaxID=3384452 RepID=UPI0039853292